MNAQIAALAARDPNFVRAYQFYQHQFAMRRQQLLTDVQAQAAAAAAAATPHAPTCMTAPSALAPHSAAATHRQPAMGPPVSRYTGSSATAPPFEKPHDDPK